MGRRAGSLRGRWTIWRRWERRRRRSFRRRMGWLRRRVLGSLRRWRARRLPRRRSTLKVQDDRISALRGWFMGNVMDEPVLVFALSLLGQSLAVWLGSSLRNRWRGIVDETRDDLAVVQAATLTLLALIIGFTFSMAISRYD